MLGPISHLFALVAALLTLALIGAVQEPHVRCPTITVTGPAGIPDPGALISFYAQVTGTVPSGLSYKWSVSTGKIVEGQGTDKAKFDVNWPTGAAVTATVKVFGLPSGCPNTASESMGVAIDPGPIYVGHSDEPYTYTTRVNELVEELEKNPNSQGYIFIGAASSDRYKQIDQLIRDTALQTAFDQSRLTIKRETTSKEIVEFWVVRPGVDNPLCRACEPAETLVCGLPFDDYGRIPKNEELRRLDSTAVAMTHNPSWIGVVIIFVGPTDSRRSAEKRRAFISNHLVKTRKIATERIDIRFAADDESRTSVYLMTTDLRSAPVAAFDAKTSFDLLRRKK